MKDHWRPWTTISSKCSKICQQIFLVSDRCPAYDVERIRDPETNEIPCTPLSALRFHCDVVNFCITFSQLQSLLTRLQIKVVQHQLGIGQAWFRINGNFVREVREPGIFELLHCGSDVSPTLMLSGSRSKCIAGMLIWCSQPSCKVVG